MRPEVGALFMVGLQGPQLETEEREIIKALKLKHFIFFGRNLGGEEETLRDLLKELRDFGGGKGLIAIDQEGGPVARLKPPLFPPLRAPFDLAQDKDPENLIESTARLIAQRLKDLGFNLNLAPVLDLGGLKAPDFLRGRTFGEDPQKVAALGTIYVKAFLAQGLLCCAKHFPGLGGASLDPHEELPSLEGLDKRSLYPFERAILAGVPCIMTTHLVIRSLGREPATFSPKLIDILRNELSFKGLVLTDDLFMGAIEKNYPLVEACLLAFEAGHDLLLLCAPLKASAAILEEVISSLEKDPRLEERLSRQRRLGLL